MKFSKSDEITLKNIILSNSEKPIFQIMVMNETILTNNTETKRRIPSSKNITGKTEMQKTRPIEAKQGKITLLKK